MSEAETVPSLGSWVRRRRKALDLTQAALAERVGCAVVTIRKWEKDVGRPARATAERLATCLAIPAHERRLFLQVARGEHPADDGVSTMVSSPEGSQSRAHMPLKPLPLDRVPPLAPLPFGSRMPLHRNPLFVGRDTDLRELARTLTVGETAAIGQLEIAAATGLGGIGKTQLACEFVHHYGQFFVGGVFWIGFADPAAVPAEVAACGGSGGMDLSPDFDTLPLATQVQRVLAAWNQPIPRLLVFDNCEEEALLHQWRPTHGGCRLLITSRRHHWDPALGVRPLALDVLPRADSLALLRTFRPDLATADADLHAIAETLGDLPLALHLAGSFLAKYRHGLTPAQYRARLDTPTILDDRSLQAAGLSPTQHVQHVARTFEQSYARLDPADPTDALALTLLAYVACFAPGEPLPRWLLLQTLDLPGEDPEGILAAEDALRRLIDLGLLDTDAAGALRLHQLVAAFVRAVLEDDAAQAAVEVTMLRVADDLNEQRNPRPLLAVQPHVRFITEVAHARADARAAGLCNALGIHLWQVGLYFEAQRYLEHAVAFWRRVVGMDHPDTARSLNHLGVVLWTQGEYAQAQDYYAQASAIRQRVLGAEHPDTARSLSNLGLAFYQQGNYAAAQDYYGQALRILERVLGTDHPDTARSLNNLGLVLYQQGNYATAQDYYARAVAIYERVLGTDHPDTARSLNNLGLVLYQQGNYAAAQDYYGQALRILERVLGTDHPDTAKCLDNLGVVLQAQGEYAAAQGYHEQAVAIQERVLGIDHSQTADSFNNLGMALQAQGNYAAAQAYYGQALRILERVLGTDHPDTAKCLTHLGQVLAAQGQYAAARRSYEQALMIYERVLGTDHPDTARSMRGLGEVLHAQGEVAQARQHVAQALAIFAQQLGPQHPDTSKTGQTLATLDAVRTAAGS